MYDQKSSKRENTPFGAIWDLIHPSKLSTPVQTKALSERAHNKTALPDAATS